MHPQLIDLVAALATGAVGSFALVRDDVSDTLPGVAIAISLVPPLAVVGLTLESHAPRQALGALILFLTNVGAILLSGLIVMAIYRVRGIALRGSETKRGNPRVATVLIAAFVVAVTVPLAVDTESITSQELLNTNVTTVATRWAARAGWQVDLVDTTEDAVMVRATGPLPLPDPRALRAELDANGMRSTRVQLQLDPITSVDLPGG